MDKFNKYVVCLIFMFNSCEKVHYYPDDPLPEPTQTRVMAHQAGGYCGGTPNTLEAAKMGLRKYDGIEVDVQLSSDNTIWLGHNYVLPSCGDFQSRIFSESSDIRIAHIDSCLGPEDNFSTLDEVFQFMADSFPDKYISIDAKAWDPDDIKNMGVFGELRKVGEEIVKLRNRYQLKHVMVESETASILKYIRRNSSDIETYLTTFGDYDRGMLIALYHEFTGLSFECKANNISANHIKLLHLKGLKIQLWTVNDTALFNKVKNIDPDFIQTDLCEEEILNK